MNNTRHKRRQAALRRERLAHLHDAADFLDIARVSATAGDMDEEVRATLLASSALRRAREVQEQLDTAEPVTAQRA
jgi:hypothetical protein